MSLAGRELVGVSAIAAALVGACAVQPARAATCGETPQGQTTPVKATLELDAERSNVSKSFGKSLDPDELSMFFKVSGCDLPDQTANPSLTPVPLKDQKNIRPGTLTPISTTTVGDNNLAVTIEANPKAFKPNTYTSVVVVKADYFKTAEVTVQVSRSDERWWLIVLIGIGLGVGAFLFVTLGALASGKLGLSGVRLIAAGILVTVTAVVAALGNYWPQSVWTFNDNFWGLLAAAAVAATTSSFAGHITGAGGGGDAGAVRDAEGHTENP